MQAFDRFKNPDGTYNGVAAFASLTGLSQGEIRWMAGRLKELMITEKKTKEEATAIVAAEAKGRPWERAG